MYNKFRQLKYNERRWLCTLNSLYNEKTVIGRLYQYFTHYFEIFSAPTAETLFLAGFACVVHAGYGVCGLHSQHFLSSITKKSLNAFYYACSYAKADYSKFAHTTASMALKLIPDSLESQPVFLCIDDTMVSKFDAKFENVSKLFDHAVHNGSNYLLECEKFYKKIITLSHSFVLSYSYHN